MLTTKHQKRIQKGGCPGWDKRHSYMIDLQNKPEELMFQTHSSRFLWIKSHSTYVIKITIKLKKTQNISVPIHSYLQSITVGPFVSWLECSPQFIVMMYWVWGSKGKLLCNFRVLKYTARYMRHPHFIILASVMLSSPTNRIKRTDQAICWWNIFSS